MGKSMITVDMFSSWCLALHKFPPCARGSGSTTSFGAQLFGTRLGTDPAEDLPIAGRGECFPGQASET
eukprot:365058-Chlamydomonas_euryale.AAC.7